MNICKKKNHPCILADKNGNCGKFALDTKEDCEEIRQRMFENGVTE